MDKGQHCTIGRECHVSNCQSISVGTKHQNISAQHAHRQLLFHHPSPYLRRVKLPQLHFSVPSKKCCPYEFDEELSSPDELCARVEFIHLKNAQLRQQLQKDRANQMEKNEQQQQQKAVPMQRKGNATKVVPSTT